MKIRFDWRAYYEEFKRLHGGDPVPTHEGQRWLFRDGWMYAGYSHQGPEYPPPTDPRELILLQREYWKSRLVKLERERDDTANTIYKIKQLQAIHNAPLQHVVREIDDVTGKPQRVARNLTIGQFESTLTFLEQQLQECCTELTSLELPFAKAV